MSVVLKYDKNANKIDMTPITPGNFGASTEDVKLLAFELESYLKKHKPAKPGCAWYLIFCPCIPCLICFWAASFGAKAFIGMIEVEEIISKYQTGLDKENFSCGTSVDYNEDKGNVTVTFTFTKIEKDIIQVNTLNIEVNNLMVENERKEGDEGNMIKI